MNIRHQMILASAGSGKTYELTNRFVRLMALGAEPERIVALTFTRKAAGEFFSAILNKLARAAQDAEVAAKLGKEIGADGMAPAQFLALLGKVVSAMHRLHLGTLDSFFANIVRSFPFELGISAEFEILQDYAQMRERTRVLQDLFTSAGDLGEAQKRFIEAFKQATFGQEQKSLLTTLNKFLDDYHQFYLAAPERDAWGNPQRIWPSGGQWLAAGGEMGPATEVLRGWVEHAALPDRQRGRWMAFIEQALAWEPGMDWSRELAYVLKKALESWDALAGGEAVLKFDRQDQALTADAARALREIARIIMRRLMIRHLTITQGIYTILDEYETLYHQKVRRAGKLTFADVQRLLLPDVEGGRRLSMRTEDADHLLIDYRLDAKFDHWLLDEFQDTSFGQWSVLENLIDEVVQDPEGRRTFFYVGDVKQAIYAWRGGESRLFREIFDRYNAGGADVIEEVHRDKSWRSAPPIIEMVNTVFGANEVFDELFRGEAARRWNTEWRAHETVHGELKGQAALLLAEAAEKDDKKNPKRFELTRRLLLELPKPAADFSVAVLMQSNDAVARLVDYLRSGADGVEGIQAMADGDLCPCVDNPLGCALLALVKAAVHPGDQLAWAHVQMTPLGAALAEERITSREQLTKRLLGQVASDGFAKSLRHWGNALLRERPDMDAFSRSRLDDIIEAAAVFDKGNRYDADAFVDFMERYKKREADTVGLVRVMTVHQSKGLGFDIVILPDLEGKTLLQARKGLAVQSEAGRAVQWVMDLPKKEIALSDAVFKQYIEEAEHAACYEKLSLLYVAMTRAKRGLYVVINPLRESDSKNFPNLLRKTLGEETKNVQVGDLSLDGIWSSGDSRWHRELPAPAAIPAASSAPRLVDVDATIPSHRLPARRPSGQREGMIQGAALFTHKLGESAAEAGREIHDLLAKVEWRESCDEGLFAPHGQSGHRALACVQAPALDSVWAQRDSTKVWRERSFEAVIDGEWITGIFDRVLVTQDAEGKALRAEIFDFKTDADVEGALARHSRQLKLYRRAASQLLQIPITAISAHLVMVNTRTVLAVA